VRSPDCGGAFPSEYRARVCVRWILFAVLLAAARDEVVVLTFIETRSRWPLVPAEARTCEVPASTNECRRESSSSSPTSCH